MAQQIKTKGIVLREVHTGESDRILTILTPQYGVISASAKSSQRLKNKLFAATGLFCYSDFVLFEGHSMYIVDEAEAIENFFGLRASVETMSLAMYLAELLSTLAPEGEEAMAQLRLLLNSFALISKGQKDLHQIKLICELRALANAGYMPDIVACGGCGCYEDTAFFFDLEQGTLLCGSCAAKQGRQINLSGAELAAMRHILYSEHEKAFGFTLVPQKMKHLSAIVTAYVVRQLDHRFKSLDFLQTVLP